MNISSKNKINFNPSTLPLATVINNIKNKARNGLDLQPDYQRGYIWNSEFKDKLIYSVSKNYPIGNIIIRNLEKPNENNSRSEVVDGQQRLTTLFDFFEDNLTISYDVSKQIVKDNLDYFREESADNKAVFRTLLKYNNKKRFKLQFKYFPERLKDDFRNYPLSLTVISNASTNQVSEYFRFVQNQERLKAGEIIKTIPESKLKVYEERLTHKSSFLSQIGFNNSRKEFDKIYYSIIGVFENKLNLGSTDKKIMSYVERHNGEIESLAKVHIDNMIATINHIGNTNLEKQYNFNKRILKLLLLLSGFKYIDFTVNTRKLLDVLEKIDVKLSAFNSAKKDSVEIYLKNYSDEQKENYRLLALLVKGSHAYNRVEERIGLLGEVVKSELLR
jgi:uncharacterized protein with ParB-like and HNH nuclease domain